MVTQRHRRPAIQYSCPNHVRGSFNDHWGNRIRRQCASKRPFEGALFISRTLSTSYVTPNIFADYLLCNSRRHHRPPRLLVRWSLLITSIPVPGKLLLIHFRLSQIVWNHFLRPIYTTHNSTPALLRGLLQAPEKLTCFADVNYQFQHNNGAINHWPTRRSPSTKTVYQYHRHQFHQQELTQTGVTFAN